MPERTPAKPFTPENTLKYRNHLSTLHAVDDSVGRVMEALTAEGLLDNTIVVFTSDNGFYVGEYARSDKRLAYEPSIKVPMLVHYPKFSQSGNEIDAFGNNLDFAPTFLEMAGIKIPDTMHGESLIPLLTGEKDSIREHLFYEYFQEEYAPGIPTMLALRTKRWKYITTPYLEPSLGGDELYDLENDPYETTSLAGDPAYAHQLGELRQKLLADMKRFDYRRPPYIYYPPEAE